MLHAWYCSGLCWELNSDADELFRRSVTCFTFHAPLQFIGALLCRAFRATFDGSLRAGRAGSGRKLWGSFGNALNDHPDRWKPMISRVFEIATLTTVVENEEVAAHSLLHSVDASIRFGPEHVKHAAQKRRPVLIS